jgi:MarR family transcriptional regulator, transcriptional regulator for hemolysin
MATFTKATSIPQNSDLIQVKTLDQIVNYLIYRMARILRYKFQKDMQQAGVDMTQEQYFILFRLWQRDGQYQAELSDDFLGDAPNITRILDGMERRHMIARRNDPADRRKYRIFLAAEGRRIGELYHLHAPRSRMEDYRGLDDRDLRELQRILQTIAGNILEDTGNKQPIEKGGL